MNTIEYANHTSPDISNIHLYVCVCGVMRVRECPRARAQFTCLDHQPSLSLNPNILVLGRFGDTIIAKQEKTQIIKSQKVTKLKNTLYSPRSFPLLGQILH